LTADYVLEEYIARINFLDFLFLRSALDENIYLPEI
jgi:hypothetical protein